MLHSKFSITRALRQLREAGWVYIKSWTHPGSSNILAPVYGWKGLRKKADCPKPAPKPRSQINKDWSDKNMAYRVAMQRIKRGTSLGLWGGLIQRKS